MEACVPFCIESYQLVPACSKIQHGICQVFHLPRDFLASVDIKDAYLHILICPSLQCLVRFAVGIQKLTVCHPSSLWLVFSLPQVFIKVLALILALLHSMSSRQCRDFISHYYN